MSAAADLARVDRCPGVLRLVDAVDGWLARIRLPGGLIDATGLHALVSAATELGDGRLELTSRGNVQLRGLATDAGGELGERLNGAGLWPSQSHERVRNIVASPLAGLDRGANLSTTVRALDDALCADPRLVELSGRFLFAIDDGRGDISDLGADVLAMIDGGRAQVDGVDVALGQVPEQMLRFAHAFLDERADQRSDAWRVDGLVEGRTRIRARLGGPRSVDARPADSPPPIGVVTQLDGRRALVVAPPLGRLTAEQASWIADRLTARPARITPWRSVVIPDIVEIAEVQAQAIARGLIITSDSPWFGVSACAGRPRCSKALADVQRDAGADLGRWPGRRVHWSGCDRQCGRPVNTEVDVVATATGYVVSGG